MIRVGRPRPAVADLRGVLDRIADTVKLGLVETATLEEAIGS